MKAVIMAGGEGSRLRPLTCDLPKPMARLCGRPMLEYILELLALHGITKAALTLRYLPDRIVQHFPDGSYSGISLSFVEETSPLGTAGSVKNACTPEDDNILVISGDAMCDFDLSAFAQAHIKSGAAVTILGKKVGDPREYGLIDADSETRVAGFIEKPAFSQAVSDIANTGIYMLSRRALGLIPDGIMYDFAQNLFPLLLARGEVLRCWQGDGYWCDIGDLDTYISCQRDMLWGRVKCRIPAEDTHLGPLSGAAVGITVVPPVYIGRNVLIEDGALIEAGSVLDDGCAIGKGARISGSIVLAGAHVAGGARLTGALVCAGASVKTGAMLFEGSTVGAGAIIGEHSTLDAGVKVWNNKKVPGGVRVAGHVKTGNAARSFFDDDGISGQVGVELTPEFCARVGAAVGSLNPRARIAAGCGPDRSAAVLAAAFCAGAQSAGAHIIDFGANFLTQFEFCMNFCAVDIGVFIKGGSRAWLRLLQDGGLPASRRLEHGVEGILSRGEFTRCSHELVGERVDMSGMGALYRSHLARLAPGSLSGFRVEVKSRSLAVQNTMRDVLRALGCDLEGRIIIELSSQGDRLRIFEPEAGTVRYHTILAACAAGEMERGFNIALPFESPRAIDDQAALLGRRVLRYLNTPADESDSEARSLAKKQMWSRDGLMQAIMFLKLAAEKGGIKALLERVSGFDVATRTLETGENPAGLLRAVSKHKPGGITEGVLLEDTRGILLIKPLKRGTGVRILAEALSFETASELCDSAEELLRRAMNGSEPD